MMKTVDLHAFDRDGTVIGSFLDYSANHPRNINTPEDQEQMLVQPVVDWISTNGGIIISNQDDPSRDFGSKVVDAQFEFLLKIIPMLHACFWSEVDEHGCDGQIGRGIVRDADAPGGLRRIRAIAIPEVRVTYRKPANGLGLLAMTEGFNFSHYVGDLSGRPDWAGGKDSDRQFADNLGVSYTDVRDFIEKMGRSLPQR